MDFHNDLKNQDEKILQNHNQDELITNILRMKNHVEIVSPPENINPPNNNWHTRNETFDDDTELDLRDDYMLSFDENNETQENIERRSSKIQMMEEVEFIDFVGQNDDFDLQFEMLANRESREDSYESNEESMDKSNNEGSIDEENEESDSTTGNAEQQKNNNITSGNSINSNNDSFSNFGWAFEDATPLSFFDGDKIDDKFTNYVGQVFESTFDGYVKEEQGNPFKDIQEYVQEFQHWKPNTNNLSMMQEYKFPDSLVNKKLYESLNLELPKKISKRQNNGSTASSQSSLVDDQNELIRKTITAQITGFKPPTMHCKRRDRTFNNNTKMFPKGDEDFLSSLLWKHKKSSWKDLQLDQDEYEDIQPKFSLFNACGRNSKNHC